MFFPWISILTQKNSTRPRVTTNPSLSILFNTVPLDWEMGRLMKSLDNRLLLSCTVTYPPSGVESACSLSPREFWSCTNRQPMKPWKFVSSCSSCLSWINFQVEDLNAKWQKYDASRDEYVKRLHLQLKEMKSQLEQHHGGTSAQRNSDLMHKEIFRLNKLLEEKMNECIKTKKELEDVKKASEGDHERIQMLEQQVIKFLFPRDGNS